MGPQSQDFGLCRRRRRRVSDIPPLLFQPKLEGGGRTKLTLLSFLKTWAVVMWETPREASLVLLPPTELGSEAAIFHKLAPPPAPPDSSNQTPWGLYPALSSSIIQGEEEEEERRETHFPPSPPFPLLLSASLDRQ